MEIIIDKLENIFAHDQIDTLSLSSILTRRNKYILDKIIILLLGKKIHHELIQSVVHILIEKKIFQKLY